MSGIIEMLKQERERELAALRADLAAAKTERDTFAEDNRRHTEATNRMMDDLVTLRKRYERLSTASRQAYASAVMAINSRDADAISLKDRLRKECDDADDVCELLGLRSDAYRTEGGSLNVPHIRALLRERDNAICSQKCPHYMDALADLAAAKARIAQRDAQIAVYNSGGFADADALAERYLSVVNDFAASKALLRDIRKRGVIDDLTAKMIDAAIAGSGEKP